ncbi:hypothetical protein EK904_004762 [Melospiza melodia maxima]|nr:hypothetical protein EK904_004762 [Melospiza melodia maxima]
MVQALLHQRNSPAFLVICAMLFSTDFFPWGKQGRSLTSNQNLLFRTSNQNLLFGVEICLLFNLNPYIVSFVFNEVKADASDCGHCWKKLSEAVVYTSQKGRATATSFLHLICKCSVLMRLCESALHKFTVSCVRNTQQQVLEKSGCSETQMISLLLRFLFLPLHFPLQYLLNPKSSTENSYISILC